ncbi:hypothetical protein VE02_09277 [Pseudogymnoascus sp. 03VT05]|nr:hypothetical protein VE02_09277 [Pseudogymnoascus sp. 03VT05]
MSLDRMNFEGSSTRKPHTSSQQPSSIADDPSTIPAESLQAHQQSPISSADNIASSQATSQVLFFGESNLLTCVVSPGAAETAVEKQKRLRYSISDAINVRASELFAEHSLPTSSAKAHYLAHEGAFTLPAPQDCVAVLQAYFQWFHPCFPIVDRVEIANRYNKGEMSPLLLKAILFIGASYCDEDTVRRMGFKDRPEAKSQLYNQTKILYDADWESNEVTVLQVLFLISFWRAGPLNVKNTRYWLGAAISLAQTRGFHRSQHLSPMDMRETKLRKRIWWSIYVRDRQSSASLGLPTRIRDEDCDIEMLSYEDFQEESDITAPDFLGTHKPTHGIYAVQMARLAQLLGRVITNQFGPNGDHSDDGARLGLINSLEEWKAMLPDSMRSCQTESDSDCIWTYLLHLAYNYLQILLHRHAYTQTQIKQNTSEGGPALQAACRVTRIVEDMLSQNLIQFAPMHLITSLFSSLCIHTIQLQRLEGIPRKLAEHRAQICLLGLKEIQKYWEVNNLVLELFFQHLDASTAKKLRGSVAENIPGLDNLGHSLDPTTSRSMITRTLRADNLPSSPYPSSRAPDEDISQGPQATANHDSVFFDMPRNILSQGGSADDFSFFLDQYLLGSNELDCLQGGLHMHNL